MHQACGITKVVRCRLTLAFRTLGAYGKRVVGIHAMKTQVNRTLLATPAWLHLQRAREAVNMAAAELPRTQLGPQATQQYALELADLMGKVELLLSTLRRQASNDPRVRHRTSA